MEHLEESQIKELRKKLKDLKDDLVVSIESAKEDAKPVSLEKAIGRLTRMDEMQQQSMAKASVESSKLQLKAVEVALKLIDAGKYGICRLCEEEISYERLSVRPESLLCLECKEDAGG